MKRIRVINIPYSGLEYGDVVNMYESEGEALRAGAPPKQADSIFHFLKIRNNIVGAVASRDKSLLIQVYGNGTDQFEILEG